MCNTTPADIRGIHFEQPSSCENRVSDNVKTVTWINRASLLYLGYLRGHYRHLGLPQLVMLDDAVTIILRHSEVAALSSLY